MKMFNKKEITVLNLITSALLKCNKIEIDFKDFTDDEIDSFKGKVKIKINELKKRKEILREGEKGGEYIETSILIYNDILEKLKR